MSELDPQAEWDALLHCPAWNWLLAHARQEWKEGYPAKIKLAIKDARSSGSSPDAAIAAIDAASDAVNAILSYPTEMMKRKNQAREALLSANKLNRGGL